MEQNKHSELASLNFDEIVSSDFNQNKKVVRKSRWTNALKCIAFTILGVGTGIGLFYLIWFFCK